MQLIKPLAKGNGTILPGIAVIAGGLHSVATVEYSAVTQVSVAMTKHRPPKYSYATSGFLLTVVPST